MQSNIGQCTDTLAVCCCQPKRCLTTHVAATGKGDSRNAGIKSAVVKTGEMWNKIIRGCRISLSAGSYTIISAPGGDYKARDGDKENDGDYPLQLESGSH